MINLHQEPIVMIQCQGWKCQTIERERSWHPFVIMLASCRVYYCHVSASKMEASSAVKFWRLVDGIHCSNNASMLISWWTASMFWFLHWHFFIFFNFLCRVNWVLNKDLKKEYLTKISRRNTMKESSFWGQQDGRLHTHFSLPERVCCKKLCSPNRTDLLWRIIHGTLCYCLHMSVDSALFEGVILLGKDTCRILNSTKWKARLPDNQKNTFLLRIS